MAGMVRYYNSVCQSSVESHSIISAERDNDYKTATGKACVFHVFIAKTNTQAKRMKAFLVLECRL
ncbi:hypothetical protein AGMMS50233_09300 [Endomicrobiia bacterium]|nr:hypothetical protein AGMMS49990_00160 [Endomicrobiia bacterium]GHT56764.1 hypothetical protein AGMMS50233_09300 [Endomicrobiia bacterium]